MFLFNKSYIVFMSYKGLTLCDVSKYTNIILEQKATDIVLGKTFLHNL